MTKPKLPPSKTDRLESIEAEVANLREQVDLLIRERQALLEARARDVRRSIGLRP